MPKKEPMNVHDFQTKLRAFRSLVATILIDSVSISEDNAHKLQVNIEKYRKLSAEFQSYELKPEHNRALAGVRAEYSANLPPRINASLKRLIAAKELKDARNQAEIERRESIANETLGKMKELEPLIRDARNAYLKADIRNPEEVIEELNNKCKTLSKELSRLVESLPDNVKLNSDQLPGGQTKTFYRRKVIQFNTEIRVQEQKLIAQEAAVKKQIDNIIVKARDKVAKMTVLQTLLKLAPDATQKQILAILNSKEILALLNSKETLAILQSSGVLAIEGPELSGEKAGALIQAGGKGGALVLADLPIQQLQQLPEGFQLALIANVISQLSTTQAKTIEGALVQQFAQALIKNIKGLESGEKTTVSFITEVDGYVKIMHVDINELLLKGNTMLREIILQFVRQGVTKERMVVALTSPDEVAALSSLDALSMRSLPDSLDAIIAKVFQFATEPKKLTAITGREVTAQSLVLAQQSALAAATNGTLSPTTSSSEKGFKPAQITELLFALLTFNEVSKEVYAALSRKTGALAQLGGTTSASLGAVEGPAITKTMLHLTDTIPLPLRVRVIDLLSNPNFGKLLGPEFARLLSSPEFANLLAGPEFAKLLSGPEFSKLLTAPEFSKFLSAPEFVNLLTGPEFVKLLSAPEFAQLLSYPDLLGLKGPDLAKLLGNFPPNIPRLDLNGLQNDGPTDDESPIIGPVRPLYIYTGDDEPVEPIVTPVITTDGPGPITTVPLDKPKKPAPLDLSAYRINFYELMKKFEAISNVLQVKKLEDNSYTSVAKAAEDLYQDLCTAGAVFFQHEPTAITFETFKNSCNALITDAKDQFDQHRSVWNQIWPLVRGILGVIATLLVLPGLVVAATSKQSYRDTFFATPETESSKKLAVVKGELEGQEQAIETALKSPTQP